MTSSNKMLFPVFQPLRDKYKPFGLPLSRAFQIIAVAVIGFALALATGCITHQVTTKYTNSEVSAMASEYKSLQAEVSSLNSQARSQGLPDAYSLSLTSSQKEDLSRAEELGITMDMTSEQIEQIVPRTHKVTEAVVPDALRFFFLVGVPVIVLVSLFIEVNRTSAYKELRRMQRWRNSPKMYPNLPMTYVERETGESYWKAVADDGEQ